APTVSPNDHHDASPPLRGLPPSSGGHREEDDEGVLPHPAVVPGAADSVVQATQPPPQIPGTATNFDGVGNGFTGPQGTFAVDAAPPDTNGDVGPNNYVQIVNTDLAVWNKTGTVVLGPLPVNTLWSGFGGLCQADNDGDPTVKYDRIADRWVISQFAVTGANGKNQPFLQCVAVSQTGDPTGAYNRYSFAYSSFPDYPKLAVWPDAYYETFNFFNAAGTAFAGGVACAYDRARMLAGLTATQQCFNVGLVYGGLLPSDLDGARLPPAGSPDYVVALGATNTQLATWKFHVDWAAPASSTLSGPTALATSAYTLPCGGSGGACVPQPGTAQRLDTLGDRLMYRLAYRNFGDHESLVVNNTVTAGSSIGLRWYELRVVAGKLAVFQQGTYAPDASSRWMGSIAQDQLGDMALGYSVSSSTIHPAIAYTGRLATDPAGQMTQGEAMVIAGAGAQISGLDRWGDYSSMAVDPVDDCTFWYTNEYIPADGSFNWKTRIGSFKFPGCGGAVTNDFSIAASPASASAVQGSSATFSVTTAVTSGIGQAVSLAASGLPAGASATFNPASVTAGGGSTLTIATSGTTPTGVSTLTITGIEGTATHSATVSLTVTAPASNDFSISASPTALSLATGTSGSTAIRTSVTAGSAATVALTVSGVPSGATATLSPTSVTAGGSASLAVNAGTAAVGTYTLIVTGVEGSATHSATVSLTVFIPAAAPGSPVLGAITGSPKGIQLSWTVPASNGSPISAYRIYRGKTSGSEVFLVRVVGSTAYRDTNLVSKGVYFYRVSAVNGVGEGSLSNEASATAR
ncbi:MAG: fibronectin type III domain-containing protein, partial [Actinomycetes bacterium]